jgi:hypothetical protein
MSSSNKGYPPSVPPYAGVAREYRITSAQMAWYASTSEWAKQYWKNVYKQLSYKPSND